MAAGVLRAYASGRSVMITRVKRFPCVLPATPVASLRWSVSTFNLFPWYTAVFFKPFLPGKDIALCYREHGNEDINARAGLLLHHRLDDARFDLNKIDNRYVKLLRKSNALQIFRGIDASQYLVAERHGGFTVDLPRLQQDTREMIVEHLPLYAKLVEAYVSILNRQQ